MLFYAAMSGWSSQLTSVVAGFKLRSSAKEKQDKIVPRLPIAKPLRPASTLYNFHHHPLTLSCTSVLVIKLDQNAGSSLFCCSSAATVPPRSCTRLGAHLCPGTLPSCRIRMQALMRQSAYANCLFTADSTSICHRFLREGEGRQVPRPEGFRCKAFPPAAIMKLWDRKWMDTAAIESIGSAKTIYKCYEY
jgi:hypothetical protein